MGYATISRGVKNPKLKIPIHLPAGLSAGNQTFDIDLTCIQLDACILRCVIDATRHPHLVAIIEYYLGWQPI